MEVIIFFLVFSGQKFGLLIWRLILQIKTTLLYNHFLNIFFQKGVWTPPKYLRQQFGLPIKCRQNWYICFFFPSRGNFFAAIIAQGWQMSSRQTFCCFQNAATEENRVKTRINFIFLLFFNLRSESIMLFLELFRFYTMPWGGALGRPHLMSLVRQKSAPEIWVTF